MSNPFEIPVGDEQEFHGECEACNPIGDTPDTQGMILYPLAINEELMGVQRCETCQLYENDMEAGQAYRKLLGLDGANLHVAVGIVHAIESTLEERSN